MGGIQNTMAIPIYRVLPYPVINNERGWDSASKTIKCEVTEADAVS